MRVFLLNERKGVTPSTIYSWHHDRGTRWDEYMSMRSAVVLANNEEQARQLMQRQVLFINDALAPIPAGNTDGDHWLEPTLTDCADITDSEKPSVVLAWSRV